MALFTVSTAPATACCIDPRQEAVKPGREAKHLLWWHACTARLYSACRDEALQYCCSLGSIHPGSMWPSKVVQHDAIPPQPACLAPACGCQPQAVPSGAAFWLLAGCLLATAGWALASRAARRQQQRHRQLQALAEAEWDEASLRRLFRESLPSWVRSAGCSACVYGGGTATASLHGGRAAAAAAAQLRAHSRSRRRLASPRRVPRALLCSWQTPRWCASRSGSTRRCGWCGRTSASQVRGAAAAGKSEQQQALECPAWGRVPAHLLAARLTLCCNWERPLPQRSGWPRAATK